MISKNSTDRFKNRSVCSIIRTLTNKSLKHQNLEYPHEHYLNFYTQFLNNKNYAYIKTSKRKDFEENEDTAKRS